MGKILAGLTVAVAVSYLPAQTPVAQTNVNTTAVGQQLAGQPPSNPTGQQSETAIAINPQNPNNIIIGANNNSAAGALIGSPQAAMASVDGGFTWQISPLSATTTSGHQYASGSDPAVAFDNNGNAYFAYILFDSDTTAPKSRPTSTALVISKSVNQGATWSAPVTIVEHLPARSLRMEDKEAIAVDQANGNVYVSWTHFNRIPPTLSPCFKGNCMNLGIGDAIFFSRSTDGGRTFSKPIAVTLAHVQFSSVAVAPNGDVYVAWHDFISDTINIARSTDQGRHFSPPVVVGHHMRVPNQPYTVPAQPNRGILLYPVVGCDPSGNIYVTWTDIADGANPESKDTDIFLRKSTDHGLTWNALGTTRKRVNGDSSGATQFNPAMAIDPTDGSINISYYDTRADGTQQKTQYFLSRSTDGGQNFSDIQVSTAQSNESGGNTNQGNDYGDYSGVAATGGVVFPAWTDTRANSENIFTARVADCSSLAAQIPVMNNLDSVPGPPGTLRFALNIATGCDHIVFQIPAGGFSGSSTTILAQQSFQVASSNITIDGLTEAAFIGANPNGPPLVVINSTNAKASGIVVNQGISNTKIFDLALVGSPDTAAIDVKGPDTTISKCVLGIDPAGTPGANAVGIYLEHGADRCALLHNVIVESHGNATNPGDGIEADSNENKIGSNFIGVLSGVSSGPGNTGNGIVLNGNNNIVGNDGSHVFGVNVISNNGLSGISIHGSKNIVGANRIGVDFNGSVGFGNHLNGVEIVATSDNVVGISKGGGGAANVISSNGADGVLITGKSHDNEVNGNFIGVALSGHVHLGNGGNGVELSDQAGSNQIGGGTPRLYNVISANGKNGVLITGSGSDNNTISGNFIGAESDGTTPAPNQKNGVMIADQASGNKVGVAQSETNVIAFNLGDGVRLEGGNPPINNRIEHNSIHHNQGLGINLVGGAEDAHGVTANDPANNAGPNALQPYPSLGLMRSPNWVTITLTARVNSVYSIELYANGGVDPSGHGQGQTFVQRIDNVTTDANGNASVNVLLPLTFTSSALSTLATDSQGNTSEFSGDLVPMLRQVPSPHWGFWHRLWRIFLGGI